MCSCKPKNRLLNQESGNILTNHYLLKMSCVALNKFEYTKDTLTIELETIISTRLPQGIFVGLSLCPDD